MKDAATGQWQVADVVSTPGSGERSASMAIDADGVIHVVFGYREAKVANTSLGYINNAGGAWGEINGSTAKKAITPTPTPTPGTGRKSPSLPMEN